MRGTENETYTYKQMRIKESKGEEVRFKREGHRDIQTDRRIERKRVSY